MQEEAIPLGNFTHGSIRAIRGKALAIPSVISKASAEDLERAGLVRIQRVKSHVAEIVGKGQDDGQGQPSSASPAAPVLPTTTSHSFERGLVSARRNEKSRS